MAVILRSTWNIEENDKQYLWYGITGTSPNLDENKIVNNIAELLEENFTDIGDLWWSIGKKLGKTRGGNLAHLPTAASYNSDFGQFLAWTKLTKKLAAKQEKYLAICDDPWVYRQLSMIPGVSSVRPPPLWKKKYFLIVRGYLARLRLVVKNLIALLLFIGKKKSAKKHQMAIVAYAHPSSTPEGFDAYFGDLMKLIPSILRLIHTDGSIKFSRSLIGEQTFSLHSWGNAVFCLSLIFKKWAPDFTEIKSNYLWLIKRSVLIENGSAVIAGNAWQMYCQERCIKTLMPKKVLWPWENHPWERELTRSAHKEGIQTLGYQHAVIGIQQFNPCPRSNVDGLKSIPSKVICSGLAYYKQLIKWGIPEDKLVVGGAFRFKKSDNVKYDPKGPVFVAASADAKITETLMKSVTLAQGKGRKFIVKMHPLYPQKIIESKDILITKNTIPEQDKISAVVYGTGASGLEGLLAGIPTFRLRLHDKVAVNVLPEGVDAVPFSVNELGEKLDKAVPPREVSWENIYAPVILDVWREQLLVK